MPSVAAVGLTFPDASVALFFLELRSGLQQGRDHLHMGGIIDSAVSNIIDGVVGALCPDILCEIVGRLIRRMVGDLHGARSVDRDLLKHVGCYGVDVSDVDGVLFYVIC